MKRIMGTIDALLSVAKDSCNEPDLMVSTVARAVVRNLHAVRNSVESEIVTCEECLAFESLAELVEAGEISEHEAEREDSHGNDGKCFLESSYGKGVKNCDFCSFGRRNVTSHN